MEGLLLEYMDWDFPYISDTDNRRISFRELDAKRHEEWKEVLEISNDNKYAVYIYRLSEV